MEQLLQALLNGEIPADFTPQSRNEALLYALCQQGVGGGATDAQVAAAVEAYLEENPVSAGKEWRLLNTVTCDGTASEYTFTQDDNGNSYHLEEVGIYIYGNPQYDWGAAGALRLCINNDTDSRPLLNIANNVVAYLAIYVNRFFGGYMGRLSSGAVGVSGSGFPLEEITHIALNMGLGKQIFPSGWKIFVFGREV